MFRGMPAPRLPKYQVRSRATIMEFARRTYGANAQVGDLAAATGLSFKTVSSAINGTPTTWNVLARIAQQLDVTPDAIADPADPEAAA